MSKQNAGYHYGMSENRQSCNGANNLQGLKFVALCTFGLNELISKIEQAGASIVAVSMETARAVKPNPGLTEFAGRLMTGEMDVVVFQNPESVGFLLNSIRQQLPYERFQNSLYDATIISTNPSTTRALRAAGFPADLSVASADDPIPAWRKVLQLIDEQVAVANLSLTVLTDSESNPPLIAGLEARGANVVELPILAWEDGPVADEVQVVLSKIVNRQFDILIFDSPRQLQRLAELSFELSLESGLRQVMDEFTVVVSNAGVQNGVPANSYPADMIFDHLEVENLIVRCADNIKSVVNAKRQTG